jgi:diguanylate cyclase (GGDEF)-like protein
VEGTKVAPARTSKRTQQQLPAPPRIISRVIQVAAEPDSTAADLAALVGKDPMLTTQTLRAVNSAYYGLRREIDTVHHAVAFMGMSAVRNLVLCFGVRALVRPEEFHAFPLETFWECSVRRAVAAACIARRLGLPQPDEFFTLGLCQDIGVLAMLRQNPDRAEAYASRLDEPAAARLAAEHELGAGHDSVGGDLLALWKLPKDLTESVRFHHRPERAAESIRGRCSIALAAEALADLLQVREKSAALEAAGVHLEELRLDPGLLRELIDEIVADVADAAEMLQLSVGTQPCYDEIIAKASDALVELSLTQVVDPTGDRQRTAELIQRNEELRREAATDPLTGLANRRLLDDALARDLAQAQRQGSQVSVLLLDIDHFKKFNDRHGHQAGDRVLCEVAGAVRQLVRKSDVCARYGGEELAVVLPFTDRSGARTVAERMRQAVSDMSVTWKGKQLSVTVSVGGATVPGTSAESAAEDALRAADEALFRAKEEGRDRVCWYPFAGSG